MYYNEQTNPSTSLERFRQVKASPGKLFFATVYNASGGTLFLQGYNQASGTPTGSPQFIVPVPTANTGYFDAGTNGYPMRTGILLALSTSATSYADPGANGWFTPSFS